MTENHQEKSLNWFNILCINVNWFAITVRSQVLSPLIIPLLIQQFVGESQKGSYLGVMRLWTLMFAILTQSSIGLISDQFQSRWGKRRPFIFIGAIIEAAVVGLIAFTLGLEGLSGYWVLFLAYSLSMVASNTSHAATQGFIPDLVSEDKRGFFSGLKASFELPLPLMFVAFVLGKQVAKGNLGIALAILVIVLLAAMVLTMFVPEKPTHQLEVKNSKINLWPMLAMTGIFTAVILISGKTTILMDRWLAIQFEVIPFSLLLILGLSGMLVAIILGVWFSLRAGLGPDVVNQRAFVWWVINRLSFLAAVTNLAGFLIFYLQEKFSDYQGMAAADPASKIILYVGSFILLSALPSGFLADKLGKRSLIVISGMLVAAGAFTLVLSQTLFWINAAGCIVGAGAGLFYTSNWALGTEIVPKEKAGQFLGISNIAGAGAGAIGAYIGGPLADLHGYTLLMAIYGAIAFLSIFSVLGIKNKEW